MLACLHGGVIDFVQGLSASYKMRDDTVLFCQRVLRFCRQKSLISTSVLSIVLQVWLQFRVPTRLRMSTGTAGRTGEIEYQII